MMVEQKIVTETNVRVTIRKSAKNPDHLVIQYGAYPVGRFDRANATALRDALTEALGDG